MEGEDSPRDTAILNFNYANTLKRFDIENVALLDSAKWRYEQALEYFTNEDPARVPQVRQALDQVLLGLQIAPMTKEPKRLQERMEQLNTLIGNKASAAEIQKSFDRFLEGGGPRSLVSRVMEVIEEMPESIRSLDEDGKLQTLVSEMLLLSASTPGAEKWEQDSEVFSALRRRMEQEIGEGKVSKGRETALRNAIGTISRLFSRQNDDVETLRSNMLGMREGAANLIPTLKNLSFGLPLPPKGSRAAIARERFWVVRRFVFDQLTKGGNTEGEREALFTFGKQLTETERSLVESGNDDAMALQVEAELARPQAIEVRRFAVRRRPYLAAPIWPSAPARTDPNAVLFSGAEWLAGPINEWCKTHNLTFLAAPSGSKFADARWRQISAANCAVFDMTSPLPRERAPVSYELGIAQSLGKPVLVVGRKGVPLPFDLDVPVVIIEDEERLENVMEATDEALYRIPDPGTESSFEATIAEAERRFGGRKGAEVSQTLKEMKSRLSGPEPVEIPRCLETLVTFLGSSAPALITPFWVGEYPAPDKLQLFHVMPFGPDWADQAVIAVEKACEAVGCRYVRGDRVPDPDIIQSIWDEISSASHVLVDLTGFNENVAFELGIAHTLGRSTLIVGQEETVDHLFPMIEKLRITTYKRETIPSDLGAAVAAWIEC